MTIRAEAAVEMLRELTPAFAVVLDAVQDEWAPELPPLTILLASVGHEMAEHVESYALSEVSSLLSSAVEQLLSEGENDVKNAVATGLLESFVNHVANDVFAEVVLRRLGPLAKEYLQAWDTFTGVKNRGIY